MFMYFLGLIASLILMMLSISWIYFREFFYRGKVIKNNFYYFSTPLAWIIFMSALIAFILIL